MDLAELYIQNQQLKSKKMELRKPIIEFHSGSNIMECLADSFIYRIDKDKAAQ